VSAKYFRDASTTIDDLGSEFLHSKLSERSLPREFLKKEM
jgi:hypothetical protein